MKSMPEHSYTDLEREVIVLKAATDLIDDMVNYEMFMEFPRTGDMNLRFSTATHQRLFNVLLVDMLSRPSNDPFGLPKFPKNASGSTGTFLYYLRCISKGSRLNEEGAALLANPVEEFAKWLDAECQVENVRLPSINIETTILASRMSFIKICGNIAKHSFLRMQSNAGQIRELLAKNGHQITIEHAYLAMPDFYDKFHDDLFNYHSSAIGEFLNNIRRGIYDYLKPDPEAFRYKFNCPDDCNDLTKSMYWDLMNWVRSSPYMPRFEVTKYLKMRY